MRGDDLVLLLLVQVVTHVRICDQPHSHQKGEKGQDNARLLQDSPKTPECKSGAGTCPAPLATRTSYLAVATH